MYNCLKVFPHPGKCPKSSLGTAVLLRRTFQLRSWALVLLNTVRSICHLFSGMWVFWRKKMCSVYVLTLLNKNIFCPGNEEKNLKVTFGGLKYIKLMCCSLHAALSWSSFINLCCCSPPQAFHQFMHCVPGQIMTEYLAKEGVLNQQSRFNLF